MGDWIVEVSEIYYEGDYLNLLLLIENFFSVLDELVIF